jgi:hypothetical protein
LHASSHIDRQTGPADVIRIAFSQAQVDGAEPHVVTVAIRTVADPMSLLPERAVVTRTSCDLDGLTLLASCDGCSVLVEQRVALIVRVSAACRDAAASLARTIQERAPEPEHDGTVQVTTWYTAGHEQVTRRGRRIHAPRWDDIADNYPASTREQLDRLHRLVRPRSSAKLLIWYGPPGTGKTTALRSLARAWEPWCNAEYVADPDRLFGSPGYLLEVATQSSGRALVGPVPPPEAQKFDLIIAEDCDEFLRASARRDAGASLGRLLNLSDGILGQGFDTLVLLTTNEPLRSLHPALARPGRCLAAVQFDPFTRPEALRWLGSPEQRIDGPVTLAQLFELRGDFEPVANSTRAPEAIGQYL